MKYSEYPKKVQQAIDRVAKRAGKTREEVIAAYSKAAKGAAVNAVSLFLA